jgi:hypothetical protein
MVTLRQHAPQAICLETAEAASLADTLDGLRTAVFLMGAGERIVHANTRGHAMLAEWDFLRASGNRLEAGAPRLIGCCTRSLPAPRWATLWAPQILLCP